MNDRITRRRLLQAIGVGGAGVGLSACGVYTPPKNSGNNAQLNSTSFDIPTSGVNFPKDFPTTPTQLRVVDSGDQKALFWKAFFPELEKKFPNVKVSYDGTDWTTIQQEITLGLHNGTAPDFFQLPGTITIGEAVNSGWLAALDDFVPNWAKIKAGFPPGTFGEGVTDFHGKTYAYPWTTNQRIGWGLLYNDQYLKQAGFDGSKIMSWDQFKSAAEKTTKQGAGRYYGLIMGIAQTGQISGTIDALAESAGAHGGEFNWQTGQYNFTSDIYQEATELILSMFANKYTFPDSISIGAPQARGEFPQGVAAMIVQGPWNIPAYETSNPGLKFGFNLPPQKDPSNIWPFSYPPGGSNSWVVSNSSKAKAVIGLIFNYVGTLKGQIEWADYDGAGDPPQYAEALSHAKMDPISRKALNLGYKHTVLAPNPELKTSAYANYQELYVPPQPTWDQTLVGMVTGQVKTGVKATLQKVQDSYEQAMDKAIAAARAQGVSISRDDFTFSNWNPREAYKYPTKS